MTPEQLKQKPLEEILKNQHEKLDMEEGESNGERKRNPPHPQKSQNKILSLTHLLKMNKRQIQNKHFYIIMV